MKKFNQALKQLRESRQIRQNEMASAIGCSIREVQYVESERQKIEEHLLSKYLEIVQSKEELSQAEWGHLFESIIVDESEKLAHALGLRSVSFGRDSTSDIEVVLPNDALLRIDIKISKRPALSPEEAITQKMQKLKPDEKRMILDLIRRFSSDEFSDRTESN